VTSGRTSAAAWLLSTALSAGIAFTQTSSTSNPFEFFDPQVKLTPDERTRLERGEAIVKALPAMSQEVAIFSAARADFSGERLVAWVRRIDVLKRSAYVPAVARFSEPPRIEDLAGLELDQADLDELRSCRPGSCGLKLNEPEIRELGEIASARRPGWQEALQQSFRRVVLARAQGYRQGGLAAAQPYRDRDEPVAPAGEFEQILSHSPFVAERMPTLAQFLGRYPHEDSRDFESFLYWSKEALGGRPIISVTHVVIARHDKAPLPEAVVASRQVFATHYVTGSLAITTVVGGRDGMPRYLAYLNRSRVDLLDGFFGGLVRRVAERRLRNEAGQVVDGLRRRLAAGEPDKD
jgi:hypothetical protein